MTQIALIREKRNDFDLSVESVSSVSSVVSLSE
jgi:hypothetical protein